MDKTEQSQTSSHGNIILQEKLSESYQCQLCGNLMETPIQTYRGNAACFSCYKNFERGDGICPIDKEPIKPEEIFLDKAKEKEILNLPCFCKNKEHGCTWTGTIREAQRHDCKYQKKECEHCQEEYFSFNETKHYRDCSGIYKAGECVLRNLGCMFIAETIQDMKNHMKNDAILHFLYQTKHQQNLLSTNQNAQTKLENEKEKRIAAESEMTKKILDLRKQIEESNRQAEEFQNKTNDQISQLLSLASNPSIINNSSQVGIEKSSNVTKQVKDVHDVAVKNTKELEDLDLRLQLHQNTTFDGRLLWKIDNLKQRILDAKTGKVTALHSAPCFTSMYGYKYCARVYLNGDGMGKGTHVSLFMVIMKSEYDNLLEWPFTKQVKFTLINQKDRTRDAVEDRIPNTNSSSFQKPVKEMNVAFGVPMFVPLDNLYGDGFVKDDRLFFEIKVL